MLSYRQLTHLLVQEAPGADFVPSVVVAAMGLGDTEEGGCPCDVVCTCALLMW
jgi:hypothetical protein